MENHVSQQLSAYLTAAALGAASAMCYDLLRTVRLRRRRNRRLTGALDAVYIAVQGLLLLWFALRIGQGELRLYMLTGMALGALLYGLTLPPLLRPLWDFWLDAAVQCCRLLCRPAAILACWVKKAAAFRSHSKLNAEKSLTLFSALFFYLFQGLKWEKRGDEW